MYTADLLLLHVSSDKYNSFLSVNALPSSVAATAANTTDNDMDAEGYDEQFDDDENSNADSSEETEAHGQRAEAMSECQWSVNAPAGALVFASQTPSHPPSPLTAAPRQPPLLYAPLLRHSHGRGSIAPIGPSPFISQLESRTLVMPFGLNTPRDRPPRELLQTLPG